VETTGCMKINEFLESTYLKTSAQANISENETLQIVTTLVNEAIHYRFKLVMVRPKYISLAKQLIATSKNSTLVGTVIGFHEGTQTTQHKLEEAKLAIKNDVDDLDFVINYTEFLAGNTELVKNEIIQCTKLVLDSKKTIKWIIEVAALTNDQIIALTTLIRDTILINFDQEHTASIYVKSSTGFFKTKDNKPNGATFKSISLMVKNAAPLPVKAAGGVRNYEDAVKMITLGVTRIGTSSAKTIAQKSKNNTNY